MKIFQFSQKAYVEFVEWAESDKEVFVKIDRLIVETSREPFEGIGKPEPLKYKHKGYWSRRITNEHRMIYKFENQVLIIVSLKGHYDD